MVELKELQSNEELEQVWEKSQQNPVLLFKHSTTCPISAGAFEQYQSFLESSEDNLDGYIVKVIETRDVSNQVAAETNIKHQSPQIFLIKDKEVLWHTSHSKITADSINRELKNA
ncbi:bacillithiol system redox-active protein YtxJ [Virgibacillus litoralis]|uniref:Bacillithiol system protein YtxJ n=1 Tax=Virgibacillus litoralis TaxID=578221 RepID=A0ABS4HH09_9BACI|nr:bacillithiol system redox-active protein YtxJ [Virgibacillus litoralis]MBP1950215.1 bacillithiol system protein YtxJ [Virgibacillus litoralis]